jgi:polar amino acid transport system permease protein
VSRFVKGIIDEGVVVILPLLAAGYFLSWIIDWSFFASLDFSVVVKYRGALLAGLALTIGLTLAAMLAGGLFSVILTIIAHSHMGWVRWLVSVYTEVFRGVPILITLFWVNFSLPAFTGLSLPVVLGGLLAMALQASAYLTDVLLAGVAAVPRGQREGARSLGLGNYHIWRLIILPQAIRIVMPAIANILASMLKASAVLSALSVGELWSKAQQIGSFTFKPLEALSAAAILYFVIGKLMMMGVGYCERKLSCSK